MTQVMTDIIGLLVNGIVGIAEGIGSGLQSLVQNLFLVTGTDGAMSLSTFGSVAVIFAGISLAIGLCTLVFHWITSLGARN